MQPLSKEERRSHEVRALGNRASNIVHQLNQGNRDDIIDSFAGIEALTLGDPNKALGLFQRIAQRNLALREAGIFARAAMYPDAEDAIADWTDAQRKKSQP